jgi:hypothetical protein
MNFMVDLNKSFKFIESVKLASLFAFKVRLNKLVDKKGFSIYNAVNFLKQSPCLFRQKKEVSERLVKEIMEILSSHSQKIKELQKQRNRFDVHLDNNDIKESIYKVFYETDLQKNDIELLLKSLCDCLGKLLSILRKNKVDPFTEEAEELDIKEYLKNSENISKRLNLDYIFNSLKIKNGSQS